ncbi:Gmad2 immunoglobulin-like domain-containing protein [Patescibacteria group bacterium]|nr:Gmad2 immunoglobulin-like domain-containing protein [Patescibacteria group bacterium]
MNTKKVYIILFILVVIITLVFLRGNEDGWICEDGFPVKHGNPSQPAPIDLCDGVVASFDDCVKAGNPVMESYPRQCRDSNTDQSFTENIGNQLEKDNLIRLDNPRPNQKIESPLTLKGEARGTWFFEGDFPVILTDWDGKIIAEGFFTAKDDWMTEEFVPFEGTLVFENPENLGDFSEKGSLILRKDNPSGLPENDDALEIPIRF